MPVQTLIQAQFTKSTINLHSSLLSHRESLGGFGFEWSADPLFGNPVEGSKAVQPSFLQSQSTTLRPGIKTGLTRVPSTKTCHFFVQGHCARGAQCKYAHVVGEMEQKPRTKSDPLMHLSSVSSVPYGGKLSRRGSQHDGICFSQLKSTAVLTKTHL